MHDSKGSPVVRQPSSKERIKHGGNPLRSRPRRASQQRWARKIHTWTSMFALVLVLFFAATGLLLNHPTWTFGQQPVTTTYSGTVPSSYLAQPDPEAIATYLRERKEAVGDVSSTNTNDDNLTASTAGPGAVSTFTVNTVTGEYKTTVTRSGVVAFFQDLHRGNAAGSIWGLVVDGTAIALIVIALSGLVMGVLNRSRHWARDMGLAAAGLIIAIGLLLLSAP